MLKRMTWKHWALGVLALLILIYLVLAAMVYMNPATEVHYDRADAQVIDFNHRNGLDNGRRATFYHTSQGSEILPIRWLRAMEDPATGRPFMENLERYGLLPDPGRDDGLAVGLTLSPPDNPILGPFVGINCAACHVGEFRHNGRGIRIDGAPNMFDMQAFYEGMFRAALGTVQDRDRFDRFVARLMRQDLDEYGLAAPFMRVWFWIKGAQKAADLRRDLMARIGLMRVLREAIARREARATPGTPTTSGFGRLDAFNGSRNFLFGRISTANLVPLTAPVKFPPLWGFRDYEWIEWTQNTNSVLERNITETLGAGATVNLEASFGARRFESTIPVRNLHELETTAYYIQPPQWPAQLFGAPDSAAQARGQAIFAANCASCHEYGPQDRTPTGLLRLHVFSPAEVGTDPSTAEQLVAPVAETGDLPLNGSHSFAAAVGWVVDQIRERAYARAGVSQAERPQIDDRARRGQTLWRDTLPTTGRPYAARPLNGVWAMAPYLHNGSVPTIADLLEPPARRPARFPIGHRDYDPVRLGFRTDIPAGQARYVVDTSRPGNSNAGHTYGTTLTPEQRRDLIEFLKTY